MRNGRRIVLASKNVGIGEDGGFFSNAEDEKTRRSIHCEPATPSWTRSRDLGSPDLPPCSCLSQGEQIDQLLYHSLAEPVQGVLS